MIIKIVVVLLTVVCLLKVSLSEASDDPKWIDDSQRGFYWGEEPEPEVEEKEPEPEKLVSHAKPTPAPAPKELSPREKLKKQGEDWEDALALAILEPKRENYLNYLEQTNQIMEQGQTFAKGFKESLWVTPEFDFTLKSPRKTQAIMAQNEHKRGEENEKLKSIAEENGILFFFRSDCPYCHKYAPILKRFSEEYGFTVIPISLDGQGLTEYPYPKKNYEMAGKLNVEVVPATFIVNPDTNKVSTVGYGYASWNQLVQKVLFAEQQMTVAQEDRIGTVK